VADFYTAVLTLAGSLTSMGGYKGWGFGLMAELLATGMAGGVLSHDVKPLKAPDGPRHDLGQYYLLIDPSTSAEFKARLAGLSALVDADEGGRMPGRNRVLADPVEVDPAAWEQALDLAGLPA
jgi:(2R)-3-sulfolactate dehydrogenase (NADP+)